MSDAKRTSPAPNHATPSLDDWPADLPIPFTVAKPRRSKPLHFAWVDDLRFAEPLGIEVRAICGATWMPSGELGDDEAPYTPVGTVGDLMAVKKRRDCLRCVKVLEAQLRRNWEASR